MLRHFAHSAGILANDPAAKLAGNLRAWNSILRHGYVRTTPIPFTRNRSTDRAGPALIRARRWSAAQLSFPQHISQCQRTALGHYGSATRSYGRDAPAVH